MYSWLHFPCLKTSLEDDIKLHSSNASSPVGDNDSWKLYQPVNDLFDKQLMRRQVMAKTTILKSAQMKDR